MKYFNENWNILLKIKIFQQILKSDDDKKCGKIFMRIYSWKYQVKKGMRGVKSGKIDGEKIFRKLMREMQKSLRQAPTKSRRDGKSVAFSQVKNECYLFSSCWGFWMPANFFLAL